MAVGADVVQIGEGEISARVALRGAELVSWRVGGRELLWQGDPAFWPERSPVLFPVVGWTRNGEVRVAGRTYQLGLHGFARHCDFTLAAHGPTHASLVLVDDAASRRRYPFPFRLTLHYEVAGGRLVARMAVDNVGPAAMPYAIGLHPGFAWPIGGVRPGEDVSCAQRGHRVEFSDPVPGEVPVIASGGLISARRRRVPLDGRTLALDPSLFSRDALVFADANCASVRFGNARDTLTFGFENLPTIVLWTRAGAPFLCVEGWRGSGDPEDFTGDLDQKPGMILLEPGATGRHAMSFSARISG
ncbi:MAG: aldose 1-epimerase family protein [Alsobacter sp.]